MKALIKYLRKREHSINLIVGNPVRKYNAGALHKLRVEIKKLNALFELINFCSAHFNRKKTFKPFKLVFQRAGKIREFQVEEATLKKYVTNNSLNLYRNKIKKSRLKEQHKFILMLNRPFIIRIEKRFHKIIPFLHDVNRKKANKYLEKKKKTIVRLLGHKKLASQQVHELRKRLKIFNDTLKSLSPEKQNKPPLKKDALTHLLGKWHDCQVMIVHLERALTDGGINSREVKQLEKIKRKISSDREILSGKINIAIARHQIIINRFIVDKI